MTKFWLIIAFFISLYCCKNDSPVLIPDVNNIDANIRFHRFDRDLFALNTDSLYETVPAFAAKYGNFFDLFTYRIIAIGGIDNITFPDHLKLFLTDKINLEVYDYTQDIYSSTEDVEKEINQAFKYYKYYYPDSIIPEIYFYFSRFNHSIVTDSGFIGIGLDKYLGNTCTYYKAMELPWYMQYKMTRDMLPVDCMRAWTNAQFEFNDSKNDLISHMIYKGKIQYFLKSLFPEKSDTILWGFSSNQLNWCIENEQNIWLNLIDNKLLFSTDYMNLKRYTEDGPFTTPFSNQSPARACVWLGYRIVSSYLKNNPDISLQDLMEEDNYQKILNNSYYEP
ncbi:MAG: hypothetical protein ABIJ97_12720 [Bacteroidota bacterium]